MSACENGHITEKVNGVEYEYYPITEEANRLVVNGARQQQYGHPLPWGERCAAIWKALFGWDVDAEKVALAMIAFKLCRQVGKRQRDNLVDVAGYAEVCQRIIHAEEEIKQANGAKVTAGSVSAIIFKTTISGTGTVQEQG